MTRSLPDHDYAEALETRRVRRDGSIKWLGEYVFVGEAFRDEMLGLEAVADGVQHAYLGKMRLGALHERSRTIVPIPETDAHVSGHPNG